MSSLAQRMQRFGANKTGRSSLSLLPQAMAAKLSPPLAERLARLRPLPAGMARSSTRPSDIEMAARLAGRVMSPGLIQIEQRLPLPWRHGGDQLVQLPAITAPVSKHLQLPPDRRENEFLLLDTETSGLSGGAGTIAFVLGLLLVNQTHLRLVQFVLLQPAAEPAMLAAVAEIARSTRHLVTYNGKSFDLPLLRARYRLANMADPFVAHDHLDLVHWMRRVRPKNWPDARLGTVERQKFGLVRCNDLGGEAIPVAWQAWLGNAAANEFSRVPAHNRLDLLSLYGVLALAMQDPLAQALGRHVHRGDLFDLSPTAATGHARLAAIHALLHSRSTVPRAPMP